MTDCPSDGALAAWLPRFAGRTVLVLGDLMLDRYVEGVVRRISPEAPIPVLLAENRRSVLGGAGNVAANVASLGARAILIGIAGADAAADEIEAILRRAPGVEARVVRLGDRPTTVKTRFVSGSHQLLRLDEEVSRPIGTTAERDVLEAFRAALSDADAVVISDYAKGLLTDAVLTEAIRLAHGARRLVVVDPKRTRLAAYAEADVLTPNAAELARATGFAVAGDAQAAAAGARALAEAEVAAVLVKRSERGLTLVRGGAPALHLPTRAREVADVSGAGDTVSAVLGIMLAAGAALEEAAVMANVAAGIAVGKPGTATVGQAELAEALQQRELLAVGGKIADWASALARVAAWRSQGLSIGFTNGCFDLIHPGHVHLLARARAECDRLVVALNSDASVRRLKGPTRPVQGEMARATVMASMASADLVVLFEEDTPERLLRAMQPDVLVKGADYRLDQVVGADIVEAHGGRVILVELAAGHSTTETIRRIGRPGALPLDPARGRATPGPDYLEGS
jgi:D-beta-D-heptose 7-phosphate kinase/D-beta-D-heptose 1-phosphate adenosyltransferase